MLRKKLFIAALFMVIGICANAQQPLKTSMCFGGSFSNDFGGGVDVSFFGQKVGHLTTPYISGNFYFSFDITYLELSIGMFILGGEWEDYGYEVGTNIIKTFGRGFDFGLLGKFPININKNVSIFPAMGISYKAITEFELNKNKVKDAETLNALWFKAGGGIDYFIQENCFIRVEILYGYRLENDFEKNMSNELNKLLGGTANITNIPGHGLDIKVALGVCF